MAGISKRDLVLWPAEGSGETLAICEARDSVGDPGSVHGTARVKTYKEE